MTDGNGHPLRARELRRPVADDVPPASSDVRDALGARIAAALEEELAAAVGADVARNLLADALADAGAPSLPVDPAALDAFVEGALGATLTMRLGHDAAREPLERLRPLVRAWARIDEHRRSERPTARPRISRDTWWIALGPERAWAVDLLAEALGPTHHVVLVHEPADLEALAHQGAERVLLLLDRAQRWAAGLVVPPHWSRALAPAHPDESIDELADAVRRLSGPR